tara:strand:- start:189 stop:989 length:801 start_codon:yes stop_codon:yes gene_type:complete
MKKSARFEMVYQISALVLSIIVVHLVYISLIRPNADAILEARAEAAEQGMTQPPDRSLYVVLRDYEQESCFILMLWALGIMGLKARSLRMENRLFEGDLIQISEGMNILPEDTRNYVRPLQALPEDQQEGILPRALLAGLTRFASTENVQDVSEAVKSVCEGESDRLDSELSMIRYIAWAIPSIGFIGTVRGIGDALGQAYQAVEGDIAGVTASLGVAFNSTFIALVLSIVLVFFMHQLQLLQERLVLATQHYCDQRLLSHLRTRS